MHHCVNTLDQVTIRLVRMRGESSELRWSHSRWPQPLRHHGGNDREELGSHCFAAMSRANVTLATIGELIPESTVFREPRDRLRESRRIICQQKMFAVSKL